MKICRFLYNLKELLVKFYFKFSLFLVMIATLSACVSQTEHQQKLDENQNLQSVIKGLEGDYENLK